MTIDKSTIISRLDSLAPSEVSDVVRVFLADEEARPVSDRPIRVRASDVLRLWETRLKNTEITSRPIYGAELLVGRLTMLPPNRELEQVGFISSEQAGNLFFDIEGGDFIGFVIADRPGGLLSPDAP